jgi:hypothetical protein
LHFHCTFGINRFDGREFRISDGTECKRQSPCPRPGAHAPNRRVCHGKHQNAVRSQGDIASKLDTFDIQSLTLYIKKNESGYINNQQERWDFKFDGLMHTASQEEVFDQSAANIVTGLFEGFNGCLIVD